MTSQKPKANISDYLKYDIDDCIDDDLCDFFDTNDFSFEPIPALVGCPAPNFMASAILEDNSITDSFKFEKYLDGSYGLIFFYPADFTFVCPTEIIAHNNKFDEFKKRNVKIIGVSVDSKHSHLAWKKMPIEKGGIGDLKFPLVSDINKVISRCYRVLNQDGVALRASFLVDKDGIIRHQTVNDLSIGRNVDETLRTIDALQFTEKNGHVCPANWSKGKEAIEANSDSTTNYLIKNSNKI